MRVSILGCTFIWCTPTICTFRLVTNPWFCIWYERSYHQHILPKWSAIITCIFTKTSCASSFIQLTKKATSWWPVPEAGFCRREWRPPWCRHTWAHWRAPWLSLWTAQRWALGAPYPANNKKGECSVHLHSKWEKYTFHHFFSNFLLQTSKTGQAVKTGTKLKAW